VETLSESEEVPIVQKELPAGSYMVSANAGLFASASTATRAGAICSLWDSPGELFKTPSAQIDKAIWTMELAENPMTTHSKARRPSPCSPFSLQPKHNGFARVQKIGSYKWPSHSDLLRSHHRH
jgi:hypothetical protein